MNVLDSKMQSDLDRFNRWRRQNGMSEATMSEFTEIKWELQHIIEVFSDWSGNGESASRKELEAKGWNFGCAE